MNREDEPVCKHNDLRVQDYWKRRSLNDEENVLQQWKFSFKRDRHAGLDWSLFVMKASNFGLFAFLWWWSSAYLSVRVTDGVSVGIKSSLWSGTLLMLIHILMKLSVTHMLTMSLCDLWPLLLRDLWLSCSWASRTGVPERLTRLCACGWYFRGNPSLSVFLWQTPVHSLMRSLPHTEKFISEFLGSLCRDFLHHTCFP